VKRWTAALRAACILYTLCLLIATHWPGVTIEGPVQRPDLLVHLAAYAVLGGLALATGWFGTPGTARAWALATTACVVLGAADEVTQPWFARSADWSDWLADAAGGALGAGLATVAARLGLPSRTSA
jgi:VanZ family protein